MLRPRDLRGTTWIGVPAGYPFDAILTAIEAELGQALRRQVRLRDNRLVEALVAAGTGLALLPRFTTAGVPGVVMRPLVGVPARRSIVALCRPDRYARLAVRTVVDELERAGAALS